MSPIEATPPAQVQKTPVILFGDLVAEIFDEIREEYDSDMIKMEIQKIMYDNMGLA